MNVGIVGSRRYRPVGLIGRLLDQLEDAYPLLTIVSGGEPTGVDNAVAEACRARGYHECSDRLCTRRRHLVEHLPTEKKRAAYFARNTLIAKDSQELYAFYAPGPLSPGTTDTVMKADSHIPVWTHHEGEWVHN